ncbi:MAG: hypothetical protein H0X17_23335 [Deltaproteobacteria bacterium]|nr:hypothetical protein [Deltaproteobacteria bacterium]
MDHGRPVTRLAALALGGMLLAGCGDNVAFATHAVTLERVVRTAALPGCAWASPVVTTGADPLVVVATGEGVIIAYEPGGAIRWQTTLSAPADRRAWIAATPAVVDGLLVIAWQVTAAAGSTRYAHQVGVLDAATGVLDPAFPIVTLAATKPATGGGLVTFGAPTQFSRATIIAARRPGDTFGMAYVSVGNIQDIQPWHGWMFELDLDRWRAAGAEAAIAAVLLTTPEADCGPPGDSGADDMRCGGGIWTPSGPTLVPTAGDDYELWIPTGNGALDLTRGDYANAILRVGRGLAFDPGCDERCAGFDPLAPDPGCMASCADLFMPRLRVDDPPLAPPGGRCDGLSFLACYAKLDLDLGASAPVRVDALGQRLGVLPAKDGAVYLFDADHLGTLHDRLALRPFCGTGADDCTAHWAGTMVTRPAVATIDGSPLIVVPTFYFDRSNPAGVVGLEIVPGASGPVLREKWSAPHREDPEAVTRFREHTGRAIIVERAGTPYVVLADPGPERSRDGVLYAIDARTGAIADRGALDGPGHKYIEPAVVGDRVFVTSCETIMDGPTHLEGWTITP